MRSPQPIGTPVGDPIECESIRRTFGGADRTQELFLGSVKDNIGHTEASSGAAALIKTILMMQKGTIPVQANFTRLNPKISPLEPDQIIIPQKTQPWKASRRIAVVNNYGAAGSNAAILIQAFNGAELAAQQKTANAIASDPEMPFCIMAKTPESLGEYCKKLRDSLTSIKTVHESMAVSSLAYNLSIKQNREFEYNYSFTASNMDEVDIKLGQASPAHFRSTTRLPVVLCIGGQNGRTVHLDEELFRASPLLQKHLVSDPSFNVPICIHF